MPVKIGLYILIQEARHRDYLFMSDGFEIPKKLVNSVLHHEGKDCFQYDRISYTYTLDVNFSQSNIHKTPQGNRFKFQNVLFCAIYVDFGRKSAK